MLAAIARWRFISVFSRSLFIEETRFVMPCAENVGLQTLVARALTADK